MSIKGSDIKTLEQLREVRKENRERLQQLQTYFFLQISSVKEKLSFVSIGYYISKKVLSLVSNILLIKQGCAFISSIFSEDESNE